MHPFRVMWRLPNLHANKRVGAPCALSRSMTVSQGTAGKSSSSAQCSMAPAGASSSSSSGTSLNMNWS